LERIISPLLPIQAEGVVPTIQQDGWQLLVEELYGAGERSAPKPEMVCNGDHFVFLESRPSIYVERTARLNQILEQTLETEQLATTLPDDQVSPFWSWVRSGFHR
jgi:hypothetical protein